MDPSIDTHPGRSSCPPAPALLPAAMLFLAATSIGWADPRPSLTVMVPMSDGTRLATDVYLPDQGGPAWPVRLIRTPYGRTRYNREYGAQARQGYAMVLQDMRGRFDSEGTDLAFLACGWRKNQDGIDTIKWIQAQPWCNGKIGTEGASAMGITQYMLAGAHPPITAQYILVAAASLYHHAAYPGGGMGAALTLGWLTDNAFHPHNAWIMAGHPFYDRYWQSLDSVARAEEINIPAVHFTGWFDVFQQGNIDGFVSRHNQGGPGARGKQKLIVGPWAHGGPNGRPVGQLKFPDNNRRLPFACGAAEWFGYYLKGLDTGIEKVPPVQYYTMGAVGPAERDAPGNQWQTADNWPVPARRTPYYFHADGKLSPDKPRNKDDARTFDYNPLNPVPTRGGCLLSLPPGPYDQRDLENRPDVLVFSTEPLTEPIEVTGRLTAHLIIASDRVDTDFTAKLTDVYPDGTSMLIADGLIRCRYRKGFDRLALLQPGEPAEVEIDLWSTSMIFNKGHRIRVAVSSSNYPRFDVNPNTGWPAWPMSPLLPARNQVFCGRDQASHIILPIVER